MNKFLTDYKSHFPFFTAYPQSVYLDSASTTQLPQLVIDTVTQALVHARGNPGRGSYPLAQKNMAMIESVRSKVATFLSASPNTIHFTTGATDGFNRMALGCLHTLQGGAEILYATDDHISFIAPWMQLQTSLKKLGRDINLIPYKRRTTGGVDVADLTSKLSSRTAIVLVTHIHNVYGTEAEVDLITDACRKNAPQSITICDATQSVGHIPVDVITLGVDALCFSGHKMCALSGVGVLYLSARASSFIESAYSGSNVSQSDSGREYGSPPTTAIASLGSAIDFLDSISIQVIDDHLNKLTTYALAKLRTLPGISFSYGPHYWSCDGGHGIVSFALNDIPSTEIGLWLAQHNIYVRTGDHCLNQKTEVDWVRLSTHVYNDTHDIDALITALKKFMQ